MARELWCPKKSLKADMKVPILLPLDVRHNHEARNCLELGTRFRWVALTFVSVADYLPVIPAPFPAHFSSKRESFTMHSVLEERTYGSGWHPSLEEGQNVTDFPFLDIFFWIL